jgi:AmmeMemoRadiSam system protein A
MPFNPDQHWTLLFLARRAVEAAVCGRQPMPPRIDDLALASLRGAFVTLKTHGQLRGCIGRFVSDVPLYQLVTEMAVAAATQDPRFAQQRLRPEELCDSHIEISVLSALELIADPLDFEIGLHGIYVRAGQRTGCFLPQVGLESGWSAEEMLAQCCARKAGLAPDAWRTGSVEVFRFTADVLEEPHPQPPLVPGFAFGAVVVQPGA